MSRRPINRKPFFDTTDYDQVYDQVAHIPEKRLFIAIIQRALYDYTHPVKGKAHISFDAAGWLFSQSTDLMSLWWICQLLSDHPDNLQKVIQRAARNGKFKANSVIFRVDTR